MSDPKLRAIKALVDSEQKTKGIDPATETSNVYALGFIHDRLDWLASDRRQGDLEPEAASPLASSVPDAKIAITKKAPLSDPSDKSPDLLFIHEDAILFSAGLEPVDVGGGKMSKLPSPIMVTLQRPSTRPPTQSAMSTRASTQSHSATGSRPRTKVA